MKNKEIFQSLKEVIPSGVNSPVRAFRGLGCDPIIVEYGSGDTIVDVDGNSYVDYCCSWGALLHGHAHPAILQPVKDRMDKGTTFGLSTPIEGELARKIISKMPSIEKIRFVSSGTEATMSAVRLARGFTGKKYIVRFSGNYHGCGDPFISKTEKTLSLPYNDLEAAEELLSDYRGQIAAVIIEPIAANMGVVPAKKEVLQLLREKTREIGALLIFDEVVSGFRVSAGGAQELYGVYPDITCLGKIIGGGFPAAAYGGPAEIMDMLAPNGPVYQAGTLSGNPVAMEAGRQALELTEQDGFYDSLEEKANIITAPVKEMGVCVQQVGSMFTIFLGVESVSNAEQKIDTDMFANFFRFMLKRGVYIPPSCREAWFVSSVHTRENLERTRDYILEFLDYA